MQNYKNKFSNNKTYATIYSGISDVYGGYTDDKLYGRYWHDNKRLWDGSSYWNTNLLAGSSYNGQQSKELWAEIYSRYMTGNIDAINELHTFFPEAMCVMDESLEILGGQ